MNQTFYGCASITSSDRMDVVNKEMVPGPGTYDPKQKDSQQIPKWTLKPKLQQSGCFYNGKQNIPAPGFYNIKPGFVHYFQQKKQINKDSNKNSKPIKNSERTYPDKGSPTIELHLPSFVDSKGGHSFGYRDAVTVQQTSPGPIYHLTQNEEENRKRKIFNKSTGFGFGERGRSDKKQAQLPGPGNYFISEKMSKTSAEGWSFAKSQRKDRSENANPTGPGEYNIRYSGDPNSCSPKMKGKYSPPKMFTYDASPASYNLPDFKTKRAPIFKEQIECEKDTDQNQTPSPFSYDVLSSSLKKGGFSLGKKIETFNTNNSPGPGSYKVEEDITEKVGGYMSRKLQQKKKNQNIQDNFYKYNPQLNSTTFKYPQYSFKPLSTHNTQSNLSQGPGSYCTPKMHSGDSFSIGKSPRFKPLVKQKSYGQAITKKQYYSTIGNMPLYLKNNSTKNQKKNKKLVNKEPPCQQTKLNQ